MTGGTFSYCSFFGRFGIGRNAGDPVHIDFYLAQIVSARYGTVFPPYRTLRRCSGHFMSFAGEQRFEPVDLALEARAERNEAGVVMLHGGLEHGPVKP